jgi:hypothetical protein
VEKSDREQFSKILGTISVACGKELSSVAFEVYFESLKDLSIEDVEIAGNRLLAHWDKPGLMPTPANIRESILGNPHAKASQALETLKRAMGSSGIYRSVRFEDEALAVVVEECGGWIEICNQVKNLSDKSLSYWEHEFKKLYTAQLKIGRKPRHAYLPGVFEEHNALNAASFERGKLPEVELHIYGSGQKRISTSLEQFKKSKKQLTGNSDNG